MRILWAVLPPGSVAGTALSAMMRDIGNKMEDGAIKIGDASIAVQDAQGNYRDLTDILTDVSAAPDAEGWVPVVHEGAVRWVSEECAKAVKP